MDIANVIAKYGIASNMIEFVGDSTENIRKAYWLVNDIDKQIKAMKLAKSVNNGDGKDKPKHAFDIAAGKDAKALAEATKLIDAFLKGTAIAIAKNGNVAYHLADKAKDIGRHFTNEVDFARFDYDKNSDIAIADKVSADSAKLIEFQSDRAILVEFLRSLTLVGLLSLDNLPEGLTKSTNKNGTEVLDLPSLRGPKGGSDSPVGKFAKLSYYEYTVDGNTFALKTDSRFIIRAIWDGFDRLDKRISDLDKLITEANGGKSPKHGDEPITFTVGKREVTVRVVTKEELAAVGGPDEEDSEEDDSE